jgi:hypothetical protein
MKNKLPNYYISENDFRIIEGKGVWLRNDVPLNVWEQIGSHFNNASTFAVFASGSVLSPTESFGIKAIGGIDWLKIETRPNGNEPPYNSYHFVVGQLNGDKYPVYGPFNNGCIVPHHFNDKDLDDFLNK